MVVRLQINLEKLRIITLITCNILACSEFKQNKPILKHANYDSAFVIVGVFSFT